MNNPNLEKPMTADSADNAELVTMFTNLAAFVNLTPLQALEILSKQDWDDDNNIPTHIRTGF